MSGQRVVHIIQPDEWVIIKMGSGNALQEWAIGFFFGSFGFAQNAYAVACWMPNHANPLSSWDVIASMLFVALLIGGVILGVVSRNKKSDFETVVREIDSRTPLHFGDQPDAERSSSGYGPLGVTAALQDALRRTPPQTGIEGGRRR